MEQISGSSSKTENTLQEAVAYFRKKPGLSRLLRLMAAKYQSLGRFSGTVTLTTLTAEEREALSGFFRKDYSRHRSATVSLERFAAALGETRFAEVSVLALLEQVMGEQLRTKAEMAKELERAREEYLASLSRQFPQPFCQTWLEAIVRKAPGTRGFYLAYNKDPSSLREHMEQVLTALADLERRQAGLSPDFKLPGKFARLPLFASRITVDPHGFDQQTERGRLLVSALDILRRLKTEDGGVFRPTELSAGGSIECSSVCFPGDRPAGGKSIQEDIVEQSGQALSGTEALNELYYHFGILRDDLLNFVTCAGIVANDTSGEVLPVWRAAYRERSVLNVPLREVVKIDLARAAAGNKVYMVENPGVFSTLLDRCENGIRPYPPLVCSHGQFKLAALLLLDKLVEGGMVIYYSGDFDPEGLLMADRLLKRHPGKVVPWRYTLDDYKLAMSGKKLPERRLRQLEGVRSPELFAVKDGISRAGAAGYQEGIIDLLWEDVTRL